MVPEPKPMIDYWSIKPSVETMGFMPEGPVEPAHPWKGTYLVSADGRRKGLFRNPYDQDPNSYALVEPNDLFETENEAWAAYVEACDAVIQAKQDELHHWQNQRALAQKNLPVTEIQDNHDQVFDEIDQQLSEAIDGRRVIFSAYPTKPYRNNLNDVAINGPCIIRLDTWAGCGMFESDPLQSPTWLEVCIAVDKGLKQTNNNHHVFLEALTPYTENRTQVFRDGIPVYEAEMGS